MKRGCCFEGLLKTNCPVSRIFHWAGSRIVCWARTQRVVAQASALALAFYHQIDCPQEPSLPFETVAVPVQDRKTLNKLLQRPGLSHAGGAVSNTVVATKGTESVRRISFSHLNEGVWINNETVNFFVKGIVQPSAPDIYCFSPCFL